MRTCKITFTEDDYDRLHAHLFSGDNDEHGAVLRAGISVDGNHLRLLVRDVHLAREGIDYVPGTTGYRALHPTFIHKHITSCRDQRWVYLAVHNHFSTNSVRFSSVDIASHEEGYPALLDIAKGMPVGALVLGSNSMEADLWMPDGRRLGLSECRIVGATVRRIFPSSPKCAKPGAALQAFDRQIRMFGQSGQALLRQACVAVIGAGGIGSIVVEYLARLGVGKILVVDPDELEDTNLSRVVGSMLVDVKTREKKTSIAARHAREIREDDPCVQICGDVADQAVLHRLRNCDYIFLAADSMRARLVFNALVHQYLIPGVQLGAKITTSDGAIEDVLGVIRHVRPGRGCLWCNHLIDATQLAIEAKSDEDRKAQAYGIQEPNPSVIALNGVSASHAVNDFLLDFLELRAPHRPIEYQHFHFLNDRPYRVIPRRDEACLECGRELGSRFAAGDKRTLPGYSR